MFFSLSATPLVHPFLLLDFFPHVSLCSCSNHEWSFFLQNCLLFFGGGAVFPGMELLEQSFLCILKVHFLFECLFFCMFTMNYLGVVPDTKKTEGVCFFKNRGRLVANIFSLLIQLAMEKFLKNSLPFPQAVGSQIIFFKCR